LGGAEKIQENSKQDGRRTTTMTTNSKSNNNDGRRRRRHWSMDIPDMKMVTVVLSRSELL
jgi:hypothetical protein